MDASSIITVASIVISALVIVVAIKIVNYRKWLRIKEDVNFGLTSGFDELAKIASKESVEILVEIMESQRNTLKTNASASIALSKMGYEPAIQLITNILHSNNITYESSIDSDCEGPCLRVPGYDLDDGLLNIHNKAEVSTFISALSTLAKQYQDSEALAVVEYYTSESKKIMKEAWGRRRAEQTKAGY